MTKRLAPLRNIRRVAVVLKRTVFDEVVKTTDERMLALMHQGDISVDGATQANHEHHETADNVVAFLRQRGLEVVVFDRDELPAQLEGFDLIVTVGGDGTLLSTASRISDTPVVGIRSAESSLAHHCLANWETFPRILDRILTGKLRPFPLLRLMVRLNRMVIRKGSARLESKAIEVPVLNDLLVHDASPAGTSRYILEARGRQERHDSSGLWIGTAAGSTGALRSAGGKFMSVTAHKFEFITREPCVKPDREPYKLLRVVLKPNEEVKVISRMRNGMLFVDGQHRSFEFPIGDRITVSRHPHDLIAFVNPKVNDRYEYFFDVYRPW